MPGGYCVGSSLDPTARMLVPKVFAGMIQVRIWPAVALSAPRLRTAEHTFVDNLGGFKPDPVVGNEAPEHRPGPLSRPYRHALTRAPGPRPEAGNIARSKTNNNFSIANKS